MKARKVEQDPLIGWHPRFNNLLWSFLVHPGICSRSIRAIFFLTIRISTNNTLTNEQAPLQTSQPLGIYASYLFLASRASVSKVGRNLPDLAFIFIKEDIGHFNSCIAKMSVFIRGYNMAFMLHIIIEVPAAINFMFQPSKQLAIYTPHAHAVIRQYAVLLASSILISVIFVSRPADDLTRNVAGSLALYHIGPFLRSWSRLRSQAQQSLPLLLSEAALYLVCHLLCGAALLFCYLVG